MREGIAIAMWASRHINYDIRRSSTVAGNIIIIFSKTLQPLQQLTPASYFLLLLLLLRQ